MCRTPRSLVDSHSSRPPSSQHQEQSRKLYYLHIINLGPIVPGAGLPKNKVIRLEDLATRTNPHTVHSLRLQIHEHDPRNKLSTTGFVVVDVNSLQLLIRITMVPSDGVDAMLGAHYLLELYSNLGATLVFPECARPLSSLLCLDRRKI